MGRLSEQKGQLLLVEAAARLRDQGITFELVIVGDGEMRDAIEQLIERSGLQEHVRITGFLSNQGVRQGASCGPGDGPAQFRRRAAGGDHGGAGLGPAGDQHLYRGIPELIEPGVNGWLVPAGSVEPLVDAMADGLDGRHGRARADRPCRRGEGCRAAQCHD